MSRRTVIYTIRFTEKERKLLEQRIQENDGWRFKYGTKEGRVNIAAYIRDTLFRKEMEEVRYYQELKNLTYQIRKIGVNINQVTAKINSGYRNYDSVFYLQKNLSQVEEAVEQLIKKLEEERGNHKVDEHQTGKEGREQTFK